MDVLEAALRWIHVVAGIVWIGHLYFFNFVNSVFAPTMDGDTKKKVVPQLMPRALYWFRWGAAWTWVTGVLLLLVVFYHGSVALEGTARWNGLAFVMIALTFLMPLAYDVFARGGIGKDNRLLAGVGLAIVGMMIFAYQLAGFSYRGYSIHVGALFGTTMAMNVWMRIWPAQRRIITATRDGQAPNPADVSLAGTRSKHNTYMSVPLVWMMLNQHTISFAGSWVGLVGAVAIGWGATYFLYQKAAKVQGF
ncbi:MAG TPA: urate hydroxylase PuuD [Candidatus Limnocylindria bacterium]|nr:urate hydroxylase PuuD [Candidatus Limnocylindria bacterium]